MDEHREYVLDLELYDPIKDEDVSLSVDVELDKGPHGWYTTLREIRNDLGEVQNYLDITNTSRKYWLYTINRAVQQQVLKKGLAL